MLTLIILLIIAFAMFLPITLVLGAILFRSSPPMPHGMDRVASRGRRSR